MIASNRLGEYKRSLVVGALVGLLVLFLATPTMGLIEVGKGNSPVRDDHWPMGSLDVANLKTRVGWWEGPPFGGGEHCFMYRGDTASFQQALDAFARIKAPKLQLIVHDGGPAESEFLKDARDPAADITYGWSFTVWNPQNWNRLYNDPADQSSAEDPDGRFRETVAPPGLDVYVGGNQGIDFSKVKVPESVSVTDERADANGFPNGSTVIGDFFDMMTSKPIVGAKILLAHEQAEDQWKQVAACSTDANGHFELKETAKGYFGLLASADGYAPRLVGYVELRGNTFLHFVSSLAPATTLTGTAVDTDGKPLAGVAIRADAVTGVDGRGYVLPECRQTKTNAKGIFELTGLPRGYVELYADSDRYTGLDILKLHSVPEEDLTIRLTATGAIKGRVVDKAGLPAGHGNVDIEPTGTVRDQMGKWGGGSNTAADGSFHFENVPPGEYIVSAMGTNPGPALRGKDPNAKAIIVKIGETTEVEVTRR